MEMKMERSNLITILFLIEFYLIQFYYSSKNVKFRQDGNSS